MSVAARRPYYETFQARVDGVKSALNQIVNETEQSDDIDKAERWACKVLDDVARDADALSERLVVLERERDEARRENKLLFAEMARLPNRQAAEAFGRVREGMQK